MRILFRHRENSTVLKLQRQNKTINTHSLKLSTAQALINNVLQKNKIEIEIVKTFVIIHQLKNYTFTEN